MISVYTYLLVYIVVGVMSDSIWQKCTLSDHSYVVVAKFTLLSDHCVMW